MTVIVRQADLAFQRNLYESRNPTRAWLHAQRYDWITKQFEQLPLPASPSGLDVGVGAGRFTRLMLTRCADVQAIDVNPLFVSGAAAIDRGRVHAKLADIQDWAAPATADVAICTEVIEHLPNTSRALGNIYRCLRPGGSVILTTPHRYSTVELTARLLDSRIVAALARAIYREPVDALGHINCMTRAALLDVVDGVGFEVVNSANLGFYLPVLGEFGGRRATKVFERIATQLQHHQVASQLLWTQAFVLRRPAR
jgi:SAM-dependent methyltransferase